jgi:1-deoxyxylulose-5-phosphate synthase
MEYKYLGNTDLLVSRLCLGMMSFGSSSWRDWVLDEQESLLLIHQALASGINFFDTANVYSHGISEEITGKAVRQFSQREKVIIATKVFYASEKQGLEEGLSREKIRKAIHSSLKRLQTDYIDLYQIHRWDYLTPIEETLEALSELVQEGKVRYLGASSMYAWQFAKACYLLKETEKINFISMQNHYNLVFREEEREMIPLCQDLGVGLLPWSPLARGFLAGANRSDTKREKADRHARNMYYKKNDYEILERVISLSRNKGCSPAQIALSWILHKEGVVSPIIGVTREQHLVEALQALDISLSEEDMQFLEEAYQPHPVVTFDMDKNKVRKVSYVER